MTETSIRPERVTKPFQLLATWLLGLIILEAELLTASSRVYEQKWLSALYGIDAIIIIPLFLWLIFLLQTKFRPEMQEDKYYSEWLSYRYNKELNKSIPLDFNEALKIWKKK